jgi:hypothetical protein
MIGTLSHSLLDIISSLGKAAAEVRLNMVIVMLARALWMKFWSWCMLCGWRWLGSLIQLIFDHLLVFVSG